MPLDPAIERLYDLNVGIIGVAGERHERPHKPLLLLAVFDLIDEGLATPEHIPWCQELRDRFTARFLLVRKHDDKNTPENPFLYLRKDGFWQAWINDGSFIDAAHLIPFSERHNDHPTKRSLFRHSQTTPDHH